MIGFKLLVGVAQDPFLAVARAESRKKSGRKLLLDLSREFKTENIRALLEILKDATQIAETRVDIAPLSSH